MYLLGIDTCGPSGTVAVGGLREAHEVEIFAQRELASRTYSATLISAIEELLTGQGIGLADLGCIVVVNGPGSFTGVRVGLAAAKGLAEGAGVPVIAVSRLEVLANVANVSSAALDAHRHEIFLRLADGSGQVRELLAGAPELSGIIPSAEIAVCDDPASALLQQVWPAARQVCVAGPSAGDALNVVAPDVCAGNFVDLALLDGHYLRRSDAEIFGHAVGKPNIRPMRVGDVLRVVAMADSLDQAPRWTAETYARALDPAGGPRRIALVAEDPEGDIAGFLVTVLIPPQAELETIAVGKTAQRQGIGRRLYAALFAALDPLGITEIVLEVRESNVPARGLYASLGFAETGRRSGYYSDPREDAILLRRMLD